VLRVVGHVAMPGCYWLLIPRFYFVSDLGWVASLLPCMQQVSQVPTLSLSVLISCPCEKAGQGDQSLTAEQFFVLLRGDCSLPLS
jgi:hypothetical protein